MALKGPDMKHLKINDFLFKDFFPLFHLDINLTKIFTFHIISSLILYLKNGKGDFYLTMPNKVLNLAERGMCVL